MKGETQYLAEVTAWNPDLAAEEVLFFSSGNGFTSSPTDTYPNKNYIACLQQPGSIVRTLFDAASATRGDTRVGFGNVILMNGDETLDDYGEHGFDGRSIVIRRTETANPTYDDFEILVSATMEQAEFNPRNVVIKLRDKQFEVAKKLLTIKYLGTGLGTLEGGTDLKGKVKPGAFGTKHNTLPPCVENVKQIYQVNDGPVASIPIVRDRGRRLAQAFEWNSTKHTAVHGGGPLGPFTDFAYGNGVYVAIMPYFSSGTYTPYVYTSVNKLVWVQHDLTATLGADFFISKVRFANGVFMLVGITFASSTPKAATSADGATWVDRTPSGYATPTLFSGPVYGNNRWLITNGSKSSYSTDNGVSWTTTTVTCPQNPLAFGNGMFLGYASSSTGANFQSSVDGVVWVSQGNGNIPASAALTDLCYDDDLFVLVGLDGFAATSVTGQAWDVRSTGLTTEDIYGVARHAGLIVAATSGATARLIYSHDDGESWIIDSPAFSTAFSGLQTIRFVNDVFMAGGNTQGFQFTQASAYASEADLLDDTKAPPPGSYKAYLAGGYFRLGAPPDAPPTADVVQGATAADRTTAQIAKSLMAVLGKTFVAGDITTADSLNSEENGIWVNDDSTTVSDALDFIVGSVGFWWGVDRIGQYRIKQFDAPTDSPVAEFTLDDVYEEPSRIAPSGDDKGLPNYRVTVRHTKNLNIQTTDLDKDVSADDVLFLSNQWREEVAEDLDVLEAHPLSPELIIETGLVDANAAQDEAARQLELRRFRRDRLVLVAKLTDVSLLVDLGDTIDLVRLRYGSLPEGLDDTSDIRKRYVVTGINVDCTTDKIAFNLWGGGRNSHQKNVVGDGGTPFLVSDTSIYVISGIE